MDTSRRYDSNIYLWDLKGEMIMFDAYDGHEIPIDTMSKKELLERFKEIENNIKQLFHEIDCIYKKIEELDEKKSDKIFKECD